MFTVGVNTCRSLDDCCHPHERYCGVSLLVYYYPLPNIVILSNKSVRIQGPNMSPSFCSISSLEKVSFLLKEYAACYRGLYGGFESHLRSKILLLKSKEYLLKYKEIYKEK